ncbi:essential meiotic structure-specific endonuclease subunit 2 [Stigmatopora argus]
MSTVAKPTIWEISDSDTEVEEDRGDLQLEEISNTVADGNVLLPPPSYDYELPSPPKKRRSKEEIEADKDKVRLRREAREKIRAVKEREKQEKKKETQRRKEAAQHLNNLKPENYLKCLTLCIDPALLQQQGSDILLGTLSSFEWQYSIKKQSLPNSITWTRDLTQLAEDVEATDVEDQLVQVLGPSEFLDMVISVKRVIDSKEEEPVLDFSTVKKVTVLVTESQTHCRKRGHASGDTIQSKYGGKDLDVEEVLVYLQLYKNTSVVFLEGWQEVTDHVCAVTKALSKRPFKLLTEQAELPFCVDGSWASGARVEKDGSGLKQVWTRQIQQLNRVSQVIASCVTAAYPSPQLLLRAYEALSSEEDKKKLLADLVVKGEGKDRRVGPEISTRIYRCLTTHNPELVLD